MVFHSILKLLLHKALVNVAITLPHKYLTLAQKVGSLLQRSQQIGEEQSLDTVVKCDLLTVYLCGQAFDGRCPKERTKTATHAQKIHILLHRPQLESTTQIFFFFSFDQILISKYLPGQFQILPTPG